MFNLITDSTSDIDSDLAEEIKVKIVPLTVIFGEEEFLDGIEISRAEFYKKLAKSANLPKTSAVNSEEFARIFREKLQNSEIDILGIFMGSTLSSTYQNAVAARESLEPELSSRIFLYDSLNTTIALAAIVMEAVRLRDSGLTAAETLKELEKKKSKLKMFCIVDTLKYLFKGGRLSFIQNTIGSILNLKPICTLSEGVIKTVSKQLGLARAKKFVMDKILEFLPEKQSTVMMGHSNCPEMSDNFIKEIFEKIKIPFHRVLSVGSVVGTHTGPGCLGIAYYSEK